MSQRVRFIYGLLTGPSVLVSRLRSLLSQLSSGPEIVGYLCDSHYHFFVYSFKIWRGPGSVGYHTGSNPIPGIICPGGRMVRQLLERGVNSIDIFCLLQHLWAGG